MSNNIKGTNNSDVLSGSSINDKINGRDGNDILVGFNGKDHLKGGKGDDLIEGGADNDKLKGADGNDILLGGAGKDDLKGGKGDDLLQGDDGNDKLKGDAGNDTLLGGAGKDVLKGGKGDDVIAGGADNDLVDAGSGNDEVVYIAARNVNAYDVYNGGNGVDTLTLNFTSAEWFLPAVQSDIANYQVFLSDHTNLKTGYADSKVFKFTAFALDVSRFEHLKVFVGGILQNPTDEQVEAADDIVSVSEDDGAMLFASVLNNDSVPDLVYSVSLDSGPAKGVLVFNEGGFGGNDISPDGSFSYNPNGVFEHLAFGESDEVSFIYTVTDANGDTDQANATITINGQNDSPLAEAINAKLGEDDITVTGSFAAADVDITDNIHYEIIDVPMDAAGHQYGSVINNNNGTFTFLTGDNFQLLNAGENRDVIFNYVAVDDSQTGNDTSVPQTVTVTVTGTDDAPLVQSTPPTEDTFLLVSKDQSIFGTGAASIKNPTLPFIGGSWDETFSETIISGSSKTFGGIDLGPLGTTPSVTVSSPELTLTGSTSGSIGLQPFFSLTGGDIDTSIPIRAAFTVPQQVEAGQTFTISSNFLFDTTSSINTQSAQIEFGVDLIFDLAAEIQLEYSSSSFGSAGSFNLIPSFDIEQKHNIFTMNSGDVDGKLPLSVFFQNIPGIDDFLTLETAVPNVTTEGWIKDYGVGYDVGPLISTGNDQIASLALDVDEVISAALSALTGDSALNVALGHTGSYGFAFDAGIFDVNLASIAVAIDLLSSDLKTKISLLQDFSLQIQDIPLKMSLEDGSQITGLSLGDDIVVTAPAGFDADVDGDADGQIDFTMNVDMDAVLTTMVSLGFESEFNLGVLRASASLTSDVFTNVDLFNLFEGGEAGIDDDFLVYNNLSLTNEIVPVFEDTFALAGFEPDPSLLNPLTGLTYNVYSGLFDVA